MRQILAQIGALAVLLATATTLRAREVEIVTITGPRSMEMSLAATSDDPDGLVAWDRHRRAVRVPARLFPEARYVRLYRCNCGIDPETMLGRGFGWDRSVPLSPHEIAVLRRSVFLAPEPHIISACVFPRQYAFPFFAPGHKLLGVVAVDLKYEDQTDIYPMPPPNSELSAVMIDRSAIAKIVRAHDLKLQSLGC